MNFQPVRRNIGLLILVLSALILLIAGFSALLLAGSGGTDEQTPFPREDPACAALVVTGLLGALVGGLCWRLGSKERRELGRREAILLVAGSWFIGAALAATPYRLWASFAAPPIGGQSHEFSSYVNCYFEAMSGLSTTGATTLTAIGTVPRSLLLWRALTQWLGGLGIVVLFVAVLPMLGVGGRRLFRVESPGPTPEGLRPRIQDAARVLWLIYSGVTMAEVVALRLCGMSWFDSWCHALATLATGGFSTQDAGVAAFSSSLIHGVIIAFMVLAGVNFGLYYQIIHRKWRTVWKDAELRVYLGLIAAATVVISASCLLVRPLPMAGQSSGTVVRDALFQTVSMQTTTGFCTADFDTWGFVAKAILVSLMFVGGSAGSTAGGIKVIRIMIAVKVMAAELEHIFRPNVVRTVKIGGATVDAELKLGTLVYVLGIFACFAMGAGALMVFEAGKGIDITTAATASIAALNNIGPGLARVGATQNYAWFGDASKVLMSILMAVGRLELFTIAVLFSPRFWRAT